VKPLSEVQNQPGSFFGKAWVKNTDFFTILMANLLVLDDLLS
jgi:hypothetical protein